MYEWICVCAAIWALCETVRAILRREGVRRDSLVKAGVSVGSLGICCALLWATRLPEAGFVAFLGALSLVFFREGGFVRRSWFLAVGAVLGCVPFFVERGPSGILSNAAPILAAWAALVSVGIAVWKLRSLCGLPVPARRSPCVPSWLRRALFFCFAIFLFAACLDACKGGALLAISCVILLVAFVSIFSNCSIMDLGIYFPRLLRPRRRADRGFTILECTFSFVIVGIMTASTTMLVFANHRLLRETERSGEARAVLENAMEDACAEIAGKALAEAFEREFPALDQKGSLRAERVAPRLWKVSVEVRWGTRRPGVRRLVRLFYSEG